MLNKHLIAKTKPVARPEQTVTLGNIRVTVLTPELIRLEVCDSLKFLDQATQIVWYRNLDECPYKADFNEKEIVITTERAVFHIDRKKGCADYVILEGKKRDVNNKQNLKGTARTLDATFGPIKLRDGVIGKNGVAVMKDDSLILNEDGMLEKRVTGSDVYIFASTDFRKTLKAFYAISGYPPLVPRYAMGNWWSRYHDYTQEEYLSLMDRFQKEDYPFSMAVIDMDWHWVKIEKQFGSQYKGVNGWTGYSWNTNLFPDYKKFLNDLHSRGYKTSLNLHPAKGVRSYEVMYKEMCEAVGQDPGEKKPVAFDMTNERFINAYFSVLHNPYEKDGVDCWWIDWQQGTKTGLEGFDPLWGLNHYHTLDHARDGGRPLILSRYAGLGSHRYPLGFSGDTGVFWSVLNFQPYFTANAANAGYPAWSHDIGGHFGGKQKNKELYLRWLEFGVFSPVTRLHSTKIAKSKEPWNHPGTEDTARFFLKLRHRLVPYVYNAYYRSFSEGRPVCEPMYYKYPARKEAYKVPNQYYFGSEMIVCPITRPSCKRTGLASVKAWLPEGKFTDIFTGEVYEGGGFITLTRSIDKIPVLAKAGAIIPFSNNEGNDVSLPKSLDVFVYSGNGSYSLYEDDGVSEQYREGVFAKTPMSLEKTEKGLRFTLNAVTGSVSLVPPLREYNVFFKNCRELKTVKVFVNGKETAPATDGVKVTLSNVAPADKIVIEIEE